MEGVLQVRLPSLSGRLRRSIRMGKRKGRARKCKGLWTHSRSNSSSTCRPNEAAAPSRRRPTVPTSKASTNTFVGRRHQDMPGNGRSCRSGNDLALLSHGRQREEDRSSAPALLRRQPRERGGVGMTSQDTTRGRVVIPDTEEARSVAERFAKFLVLGAFQPAGAGAATALARDAEACRIEQPNSSRSALPCLSNQVDIADADRKPAPELGVERGQTVADARGDSIPVKALGEPPAGHPRNEEGDQLCMSY